MSGWTEHHCVAVGSAAKGMAGRIGCHVRLDLDDPADALAGNEQLVQQERGDDDGVAGEVSAANPAHHDSRSRTISGMRAGVFAPGLTLT